MVKNIQWCQVTFQLVEVGKCVTYMQQKLKICIWIFGMIDRIWIDTIILQDFTQTSIVKSSQIHRISQIIITYFIPHLLGTSIYNFI